MQSTALQISPGFATRWIGLLFIGLSVVVISLDNTILNTALPLISRTVGATTNELQWIVDAYVLVFAALLLTTGSIGDRFGRKRMLQFGLVWFALDSLLAANTSSTGMLIAVRAILAVGGALILPATLSIISATFPTNERPQAIALWAAIFGLGVSGGPVLGGFLLQHFPWNSVFLVNIPFCLLALAGGALFLAESKDANPPRIDLPGVVLSIIGLFLVVYGIIQAGVSGWANQTVLLTLGAGLVVLFIFGIWETSTPNAMLPMRFFKNMSFTGASVAMSLTTFSQFSVLFFLSPFLQTVQGYSTLEAGLRLLPFALTMVTMASLSARITVRLGTKRTVALGIAIAACGSACIALIFTANTPFVVIAACEVILGFGVGTAFSPATNSIMGAVPIDKAGIGSAMNDTTRQLGGALGVAVLGAIMNSSYVSTISALRPTLPPLTNALFMQLVSSVQAAHVTAASLPGASAQPIINASNLAYVTGMSHALLIGAGVMVIAAGFVLVFLPAQVRRSEETALEVPVNALSASAGD